MSNCVSKLEAKVQNLEKTVDELKAVNAELVVTNQSLTNRVQTLECTWKHIRAVRSSQFSTVS